MKKISAPEMAALLADDNPIPVALTSAEAIAFEKHVRAIAVAIGRKEAKVRRLRADLRRGEAELKTMRRDLKAIISVRRPA